MLLTVSAANSCTEGDAPRVLLKPSAAAAG